ncbi:transcription factor Adf-1-like [Calliphora vicina]|uniref:transcription factor Adf-1-like n=1 Tax=Calliphora vicina TaxID=7373 RepID=UPI00325AF598
MSVPVKRKRGRPRLDEPKEIKDFDNNLILEFKKCPAFYDRQHPQHRNREYTDRVWHRIAQNLNVSANLVKTRMLQLRNRFNLEKRRVEAMKEQQPRSSVASHWSLYERLSFLSDYVKTRRPYSLPISCNTKADSTASSSDIDEEENEEEDEGAKTQESAISSNQILTNGNLSNNIRNADDFSTNENNLATEIGTSQVNRTSHHRLEAANDFGNKYKAFGQFLASSLIEMNEIQALGLVEKFTTELVKYLKTEERKKELIKSSQISNTGGDDENSLTVY